MSAKHTPGPWVVSNDVVCAADGLVNPIKVASGWIEGTWRAHDADDESRANARLIAAAPSMLSALERIRAQAVPGDVFDELARAAIAKATGESA